VEEQAQRRLQLVRRRQPRAPFHPGGNNGLVTCCGGSIRHYNGFYQR